jgi:hypothetical protein
VPALFQEAFKYFSNPRCHASTLGWSAMATLNSSKQIGNRLIALSFGFLLLLWPKEKERRKDQSEHCSSKNYSPYNSLQENVSLR